MTKFYIVLWNKKASRKRAQQLFEVEKSFFNNKFFNNLGEQLYTYNGKSVHVKEENWNLS